MQDLPSLVGAADQRISLSQLGEPLAISRRECDGPLEFAQTRVSHPFLEVCPPEGCMCAIIVGIVLQCACALQHSLVIPPGTEERGRHIRPVGQRVQLLRPPD